VGSLHRVPNLCSKDTDNLITNGQMKEKTMHKAEKSIAAVVGITGLTIFLLASFSGVAQDKPKREVFQAQAMGTGTQMGQNFGVTLNIGAYSTPEQRQILIDAFDKTGSKGLFNALEKMPSKGRMSVTGTLVTT
jgi:hypothetical protein